MMGEPVVVDLWSDVVCPWCRIGKARLDRAIAEEPAGSVVVRWRAFTRAWDRIRVESRTSLIAIKNFSARQHGQAENIFPCQPSRRLLLSSAHSYGCSGC